MSIRKNSSTHRRGSRQIFHATVLVGVSVAVTLALAEVLLRLFPSLMPEEVQLEALRTTETYNVHTVADSYLGFHYPSTREVIHQSRDFAVRFTTDEHGFRNDAQWPAQADVIIVGDSLSFGYGVDQEHAWPRIVAKELRPARVINLSLPGTGPPQYLRIYKKYGTSLRPKLLLFCIFSGNDIRDTRRFQNWEAAGAPGDYSLWHHANNNSAPPISERSYLLLSLRSALRNLRAQFHSQTIALPSGGRLQLVPEHYKADERLIARADRGFTGIAKAVTEAKALADRTGTQLLVVLFPTKEEVYLPLEGRTYPHLERSIRDSLRDTHVDILDLTGPLRSAAHRGPQLYFEIDGHPNDLGNHVIAERVLVDIQRNLARYRFAEKSVTRRLTHRIWPKDNRFASAGTGLASGST